MFRIQIDVVDGQTHYLQRRKIQEQMHKTIEAAFYFSRAVSQEIMVYTLSYDSSHVRVI